MEIPTPHPLRNYGPNPGYDDGGWLTAAWLDR